MQLYYGSLAWIVPEMELWWSALGTSENHDAQTFKKSAPRSSPNHTAPLRSHTLIVSNRFCHDRFISEPAAIEIVWLRARARYYCWRVSFGPRAACCRPLLYRDIRTDQRDGLWDLCTNLFLQNAGDFSQGSVQARHFVTGPLATVLPLLLLY